MRFLVIIILLILAGWPLSVSAQHFGAWRVAYGDSSRLAEDLPALMNPMPLQEGYRAEGAPIWFSTGSRMQIDGYDPCEWKTPKIVKITLGNWWDIIGIYPEARYVFDDSGRFVEYDYYGQRYGNPDYLDIRQREVHRYDESGQLEHDERTRYRAHPDSFSTVSNTYSYRPDGKLLIELIRYTEQPTARTDRMDSVHYSYNSNGEPEEKITFSGPMPGLLVLSNRMVNSYDSLSRLSQTRQQDWLSDRQVWLTNEQVDYEYDDSGKVNMKTTITAVEGDCALYRRFTFQYSADGSETIITGFTQYGITWVEDYYFREVVDARGQPLILDEFHRNNTGELYVNRMGKYRGIGRTNGDLRGKNRFAYDEDGLITSYLNFSRMDQDENLPDIKREFKWKKTSNVPIGAPGEPEIRLFPNPCAGFLIAEIGRKPGTPANIEILDQTGKVYLEIMLGHDDSRAEINLADLSPGLYLARIRAGGRISVLKFVRMAE
jgi:hypothetical protein